MISTPPAGRGSHQRDHRGKLGPVVDVEHRRLAALPAPLDPLELQLQDALPGRGELDLAIDGSAPSAVAIRLEGDPAARHRGPHVVPGLPAGPAHEGAFAEVEAVDLTRTPTVGRIEPEPAAARIEVPCRKATEALLAAHVCQLIANDHGELQGGEGFYDNFYIRDEKFSEENAELFLDINHIYGSSGFS